MKSDNIAESIATIIFNPSNSMGKVRIITPVEIASKRFEPRFSVVYHSIYSR